jgi:hypothetical protein
MTTDGYQVYCPASDTTTPAMSLEDVAMLLGDCRDACPATHAVMPTALSDGADSEYVLAVLASPWQAPTFQPLP